MAVLTYSLIWFLGFKDANYNAFIAFLKTTYYVFATLIFSPKKTIHPKSFIYKHLTSKKNAPRCDMSDYLCVAGVNVPQNNKSNNLIFMVKPES